MKQITLEIPNGKKAEWVNGVLTLVDEAQEKPKDVMERIKTFEDALDELGDNHPFVVQYWQIDDTYRGRKDLPDLMAYLKLRIICAALNEGWQPKFTKGEYRYYPWFKLYTQDKIDNMSDEERSEVWCWGGSSYYGSYCGLGSSNSAIGWSTSYANLSARLALKSEELAVYCGKQFIDIWADYCCTMIKG